MNTRRDFPAQRGWPDNEVTPAQPHDCANCAALKQRVNALEYELERRLRELMVERSGRAK